MPKGPKRTPKSQRHNGQDRPTWTDHGHGKTQEGPFLCLPCESKGKRTEVHVSKRGGLMLLCDSCRNGSEFSNLRRELIGR